MAQLQLSTEKSSLDGLWVLLVQNNGQLGLADPDDRVPIMAKAGNEETYLLGFKNMVKARTFIERSELLDVEPRMVVKANKSAYLQIASRAGAAGVLIDYDPATQQYAGASELY